MKFLFLFVCAIAALHAHYNGHAAQLRRVWMQDHCQQGICTGIEIGRNDYVILSQMPIAKQLMLTFLNSSIAKIPHLMFDTFPDLQVLRMENCSVETFEKPQFEGASNLMSLFLGHNLLRDIPKNIFLGADNLNTLHMNHNQLRLLHNSSFHALKELRELSLADNQLEQLPLGVFTPLRKLLDLNLGGNRLAAFPRGIFDRNFNLTRINLSRNRFVAFESELFKLQPRIKLLDLSGNELQELTLNFAVLESVHANNCDMRKLTVYGYIYELELRNNSLRELPHIPHAANVTSLDLSLNPLGTLQGNPLRRYTGLQRLNLSATGMHEVPEDVFKKQTQLKLLDISANSLYNLKFALFSNLKSLQYFYFQQNNWNCDFLQLLMNSFVKKRDISFMEDATEPELVDDYVDGVACWYESNKPASKKCSGEGLSEAALELAIVRNDIKSFMEVVEKKFVKVYRMLDELKMRL
ncbi:PREDICTED: carboxypeptidase N subunit 2-like isoform X1 [Rhagoletis zephyria]|uniref:carboxypeptidase N subunit 2-like isoform X1 n=1 Tax=Rhagoletis zephyria TaxID=28612 RepID=UPI0008112325|nr:PREDICTED: carboxypeptidase N subunit 2-like isoform X1 [Rhagoletis zephyria]